MFPRKNRINSVAFREHLSASKTFFFEYFRVMVLQQKDLKISCVVSKKNFKKRFTRNYHKRRFLSALREVCKEQSIESHSWIFFIQKNIQHLSYFELKQEIVKSFNFIQKKIKK